MFNTTSLFAAMEKKKILDEARFDLRLFQLLHEKALKMNVVEKLAKCIAEGSASIPSIPFLSYQVANYDDGEQLASPELTEQVRPHVLRNPQGPKVKDLASSLCTTLVNLLVEDQLPRKDGYMLFMRTHLETSDTPAQNLFHRTKGAMALFAHFLGKGLEVSVEVEEDQTFESGEPLPSACRGQTAVGTQKIVLSTIQWNIVFTGKEKKPWTIPENIPEDSLIWRTLNELLTTPLSPSWTRLSFPYWKNSRMNGEIVAWCEAGNDLTEEMSWEMMDAGDRESGRKTGHSTCRKFCSIGGCGGAIGNEGFCQRCCCKFVQVDETLCPKEQVHHLLHMARVNSSGEPVVHAIMKCKACLGRRTWVI